MIQSYQFLNENGPLIPTEKTLPNFTLNEGVFSVDNIEFNVIKVIDAFTAQSPEVQKNWIKILENIKSKNYSLILGGHGTPSAGDIISPAIAYLRDATTAIQQAVNEGSDKESKTQIYSKTMIEKYPNHKGQVLTQLSSNYMFN